MQAFSARRADIAESLLQSERQQTAEMQAEVAELHLLLEEQVRSFGDRHLHAQACHPAMLYDDDHR